jgi:hypothetical protein
VGDPVGDEVVGDSVGEKWCTHLFVELAASSQSQLLGGRWELISESDEMLGELASVLSLQPTAHPGVWQLAAHLCPTHPAAQPSPEPGGVHGSSVSL